MADGSKPAGFVSLKAVKQGPAPADPAAALAEIRQIYFKTTKATIEHDFAHAIQLLKGLPDEDARAKAHVYMEGLAEMQREWSKPTKAKAAKPKAKPGKPPTAGSRSSGGR